MEVSGQLNASAAVPQEKGPWYPLDEAEWAPEPVWTQWWGEKFPVPTRT